MISNIYGMFGSRIFLGKENERKLGFLFIFIGNQTEGKKKKSLSNAYTASSHF